MSLDKYRKTTEETSSTPSSSESANPNKVRIKDRIGIFVFGLIFFSVGCAAFWFLGVKPFMIRQAAQSWPAVEAVVTHSGVKTNHDSDGNTYAFEVLYRYSYEGKQYESDKYKPSEVATSDYSGAARLKDRYRKGSNVTAYVNPDDPYYAIMNRETEGSDYFALFTLLFVLVGGGIMYAAFTVKELKTRRRSRY